MHLRSWENEILSERKNSSVQISNFRASSREEPRHREKQNSEVSRGSKQCPCPLIFHQREPRGDQHVSEWFSWWDSYQLRPSLLTSPILYFPPSNSTNIVLLEFYIKPKRREKNIFYSISRFLLFLFLHISTNPSQQRMFLRCRTNLYCLYSCERRGEGSSPLTSHWESKVDEVHISLG